MKLMLIPFVILTATVASIGGVTQGLSAELDITVGDFGEPRFLPACPMQTAVGANWCEHSGTTCGGSSQEECLTATWKQACLVETGKRGFAEGAPSQLQITDCTNDRETGDCVWTTSCVPGPSSGSESCGNKVVAGSC